MTENRFLSDAAISRILTAAGIKELRPHIDRASLEECLRASFDRYREAVSARTKKSEVERQNKIRKVQNAARELRQLLAEPPNSALGVDILQLTATLSELIADQDRLLKLNSLSEPTTDQESLHVYMFGYRDHFKAKSPLQWLVGVYIPKICENFSIQLKGKQYAEFACQILKEMKVKNGQAYFLPDAIARVARGYLRWRKLAPRLNQEDWMFELSVEFSNACGVPDNPDPSAVLLEREKERAREAESLKFGPK